MQGLFMNGLMTNPELVPGTGIEPVHHFWREILSLLCLPISPPGQGICIVTDRQQNLNNIDLYYLVETNYFHPI